MTLDNLDIGVDIESISQFREKDFNQNTRFYENIFTEDEIKYCLSKGNPYQHFAVRFCAKEAFIKAMDKSNISYRDIEIKMRNNKPILVHKEGAHIQGKLSLSHDKDKAIAFVVIEK